MYLLGREGLRHGRRGLGERNMEGAAPVLAHLPIQRPKDGALYVASFFFWKEEGPHARPMAPPPQLLSITRPLPLEATDRSGWPL
jgi:hypothetical protein